MFEFRIYCAGWLIQQTLNLFLSFDFIIENAISVALFIVLKHDFWHALSDIQSHLKLSELYLRAHRQADVTDHQLHDQVYYGRYNSDQSTKTQ